MSLNIVFMGTPDFARKSLEAIYNENHNICAVVTNIDKPSGRGMKLIPSDVKIFAEEKGLRIYQPQKVRKNEEFLNEIKAINPDVIVVVAYGKILPQELLDIPQYGSINVHGSLLPKLRGAAPIQWSVLNGDKETGITTMFMDAGMDTGDIILQEKVEIGENETTGELFNHLADVGANLLIETLRKIEQVKNENESISLSNLKEKIGAKKQEGDFTLAPMINKEMAQINFSRSAREIHNLIRGLNPILGAYAFLNNKKIKMWKSEIVKDFNCENKQPGEIVLADKKIGLYINTGNGVISITEIQGENAKKMDIKSFLNGNQLNIGEIFN